MTYPPRSIGEERNEKPILLGQPVRVCLDGFSDLIYTIKPVSVAVLGCDGVLWVEGKCAKPENCALGCTLYLC